MREITVFAEIHVDVPDVFKALRTEELRGELERRYEAVPEDLHDAISRAALKDIPLIIERMQRPKWRSTEACREAYHKAMRG